MSTTAVNGSTHKVAFTATGLPSGVMATFNPPQVTAGGSSTLTLSTNELSALGGAMVTITGKAVPATTYPTTVTVPYKLEVTASKDPGRAGRNDTDVAVPDGGLMASIIVLPGCVHRDLTSSEVEVHINHQRRGDLIIDLIAPSGREYRLRDFNPADLGKNVHETFQVQLDEDSDALAGSGRWQLRVEDFLTGVTGTIDSWSLYL